MAEAAAVIMSRAGAAMRPQLAGKAKLLSLASERLVALCQSESLRGAKASVRQGLELTSSCFALALGCQLVSLSLVQRSTFSVMRGRSHHASACAEHSLPSCHQSSCRNR